MPAYLYCSITILPPTFLLGGQGLEERRNIRYFKGPFLSSYFTHMFLEILRRKDCSTTIRLERYHNYLFPPLPPLQRYFTSKLGQLYSNHFTLSLSCTNLHWVLPYIVYIPIFGLRGCPYSDLPITAPVIPGWGYLCSDAGTNNTRSFYVPPPYTSFHTLLVQRVIISLG